MKNKLIFLIFIIFAFGKISSCQVKSGAKELTGNKQNIQGDSNLIEDKLFSIETLRADLKQIKDILINNHQSKNYLA